MSCRTRSGIQQPMPHVIPRLDRRIQEVLAEADISCAAFPLNILSFQGKARGHLFIRRISAPHITLGEKEISVRCLFNTGMTKVFNQSRIPIPPLL